jgi:hypothetical protein
MSKRGAAFKAWAEKMLRAVRGGKATAMPPTAPPLLDGSTRLAAASARVQGHGAEGRSRPP